MTFGAEALWLRKSNATRPAQSNPTLARDDAFGELLRTIRDPNFDDTRLAAQGADLAELTRKLPPPARGRRRRRLRSERSGADPRRLDAVKALLVARLLEDAADP